MITDIDIKKMKRIFATKEDLKKFATKKDFELLSNKFDKKFATKDQIYSGFEELIEFIGETKNDIMKELSLKPGPKIGEILQKLFEEVDENLELNKKDYLLQRIKELQ